MHEAAGNWRNGKSIGQTQDGELLPEYPDIPWKQIMAVRDRIAHQYFEVNPDLIFDILKNNIVPLLVIIKKMKNEI
ncbi:hypothetical protein FACS189430_08650 [Bacteroidia bacterium]|nr:hypothetical protein FACS189430_08650 [Bacteroidia bacterium]